MVLIFPNGISRHIAETVKRKAMGVKAGVPDICLPVVRKGCHGLYNGLKRIKGGRLTVSQIELIEILQENGYMVAVARVQKKCRK